MAAANSAGRGRLPEDFPVAEETLFPSASAALYRRTMLEEIGGFDDRFFLYCEDTDLGLRARWPGGSACTFRKPWWSTIIPTRGAGPRR